MSFRLRPSSKKSTDTQNSIVQFPKQSFVSNQIMTLKQMMNKIQQLDSNVSNLNQIIRKDREISNAGYIDVQKRLDIIQYKSFSNEKDIKQINDINRASYSSLQSSKKDESSLSKNEISLLKQTLLQERQSQRQHLRHLSSTIQQMSMKQLRLQQQMRSNISSQKEQYDTRLLSQQDELRSVQNMKLRKIDQQYQMIKGVMEQTQRKIYDELDRKIRKQGVMKDYVQDKINQAKQQIAQQHKLLVSSSTKLTRQTKQSLESLYNLINQTKNQLTQQLSQTQQLSVNNIKRLSMSLDILSEGLSSKLKGIQSQNNQLSKQMSQFKSWTLEKLQQNREIMNQIQEQAFERVDSGQKNQQGTRMQNKGFLQQKFNLLTKDINQWKSLTQQKNLSIFKEISQAMKTMKLQFKKENDQVSSELISLTESLKSIKKSLPTDMKKISQSIITIFNDQFDVLAQELDLMAQMINASRKEMEKIMKEQIKKNHQIVIEQAKGMILTSKKQMQILSDKAVFKSEQNMKNSLQKQSKYLENLFNQKLQHIQTQLNKLFTNTKKTNLNTTSQLQAFTLSMKSFNQNYKDYLEEQRKQDMKKRIQLQDTMRKNASNLMDICYKKSQFLVQGMKNAIQMNIMKETAQNKQQVQLLKDQLQKHVALIKRQFVQQLTNQAHKLTQERETAETTMQQNTEEAISSVKRSLGIEIGNNKLEFQEKIQVQKELVQILEKDVSQLKKKMQLDVKQLRKSQIDQSQKLINQLKTKSQQDAKHQQEVAKKQEEHINLMKKAIEQKIDNIQKKQLVQKQKAKTDFQQQVKKMLDANQTEIADKQQESMKQFQQTLASLRETVWKMEAMNFSEQAKNKALFDRVTEDLNHIGLNLAVMSKEVQIQLKKKQTSQKK